MRLSLLFIAAGFLVVLLQTTVLHLLPLGRFVPDLALVLCVYLGLNHPTVGAVLGSFILGYSVDVFSAGGVLGLNAFAFSLVFLAVYVSSRAIWVHSPLSSAPVVFFASWIKVAALQGVWTLFLAMEGLGAGALKYTLVDAILAAVLAPGIFSLLKRGQSYLEEVRMPVL
ncbi:MAG: rod shape-determining protein MreD [Deltaproteobacteria bacterium RIFCSPLOWO2_12_FULL_60_19]|nr:MAG: rod shape-determining protein MreD [Deltaproteobacteria bacterium RIFCSPLOWO2_12_FULL_60_19]